MTKTFAMTKDTYDLYIGKDGNLAIASNIDAVLYAAQTAAQAVLGEMVLSQDTGVNYFQSIWVGQNSVNVASFEQSISDAILSVEGVTGIANLTVSVQDNVASYSVTIDTIYGQGALNG